MPDSYGPLQHVTIAGTLWLILVFPFAAAAYCAARALWGRKLDTPAREAVTILSVGALGLSLALGAYHAVVLGMKPESERFFLQHLWRLVRVGQLDASFDLAFDPLAATMVLVVTGVGVLVFVFAASYMEDDPAYARFFAWLNAFAGAMLLLVLADNFVLMFFGWEGVGLCSWGLIGFWWDDRANGAAGKKAFIVSRVGDAGFVLGVALLYWGLGGTWADTEYAPGLDARFASVEVGEPPAEPEDATGAPHAAEPHDEEDDARSAALPSTTGEGYLTLTSYSGAVVFMDDARTPLHRGADLLRAPFVRFPIRGGLHSFRVHPGGGLDDFLVTHVAFGGGREIALTSFGPTVTFRNLRDQLASTDAHGHAFARDALVAKAGWGPLPLVALSCLLLFVGAVGKSAQFPLYVWLPDAMAGPTPVSALIHAATMVTAGVYLLARLSFLFALAPLAGTVIAVVGAVTSLLAAISGLYAYDLKRVLAYSTISQLGLMVLAAGAGAYGAAVFHLVTHAAFKACLFLAAGAVLHVIHDESGSVDLRRVGGLKRALPRTARAYFVACLAITSAPIPGLSGFWSKDEVLVGAFSAHLPRVPAPALGVLGLVTTAVTSYYVWRTWYVAFDGELRPTSAKDGPPELLLPVTLLAGVSVVLGLLGVSPRLFGGHGGSLLEEWLEPVFPAHAGATASLGVQWAVIAGAYGASLGGWALARATYGARRAADWEARERATALYRASASGFGLDALYAATVVPFTAWTAEFLAELDQRVIDGTVNAAGVLTRAAAWVVGKADDEVVDGAVRAISEGTLHAGERLRRMQTGRIQTYVYVICLGVLALAFLQYWLR